LVNWFVDNPVKVAVGVLLVFLFGVIAVQNMSVELTPQVERPTMSVRTRWPAAGPEEVEREIVVPQEEQLNAIPGMIKMSSRSSATRGSITTEFAVGTDLSEAIVKVNTQLQQVSDYPEDAQEPVIRTADERSQRIAMFSLIPRPPDRAVLEELSDRQPELKIALNRVLHISNPTLQLETLKKLAVKFPELGEILPSEINIARFRSFAEQVITARIARVDGVADVWVWAGTEEELQVIVDPQRLAARRLTIGDVRRALRRENADTAGGDFDEGKRRYVVRTMGRFRSPEQVSNVILAMTDDVPVYIGDVAEVNLGYKKPRNGAVHFQTPCMRIGVVKEPGANIMEVMDGVKRARDELNNGILKQQGIMLHQAMDMTLYIRSALTLVSQNLLMGGSLTLVVLMIFLHFGRKTLLAIPLIVVTAFLAVYVSPWIFAATLLFALVSGIWFARGALVVALAIPTSMIGALLMLALMGRTLNVISLSGMAFAIGMLVDNAVVVLENIYRHAERGENRWQAAVNGTKEVWGATLASTLTTLAVFVPMLFVQEESGQLFRDISLAISCGVGLSLLVAISVIPTAAARLLPAADPTIGPGDMPSDTRPKSQNVFVEVIVGVNRWLQKTVFLRILVVLGLVVSSLGISYLLLPAVEYLPKGNRNRVAGRLTPPPGYNVAQTVELANVFHDALRPYAEANSERHEADQRLDGSMPLVDDIVFGTFGRSAWFSARTVDPARAGELVPFLNELASSLPGTEVSISQASLFEQGWARSGRRIDIEITGPDLNRLVIMGRRIRDQVRELIEGATAFPRPGLDLATPELHVMPKSAQAAAMGVNSSDLGYTVNALVDGAYASEYFHEGEQIDLTVMGEKQFVNRTQDVQTLPIAVPTGDVVPLAAVADVELRTGPDEISHIERQRAITISVSPPVTIALGEAMERIEQGILRPLRDEGEIGGLYNIELSGTADKLRAAWRALRLNLVIALLITYLLMAGLFESWLYPFVIMVSVPMAVIGGLGGLHIVNYFVLQQLDILTMLGFIILVGTVVNNAILIVHQALNQIRDKGMEPRAAILESVRIRVRPIFMTTLTTTFGLLPLVLFPGAGSELYRGLGSVVLGGLIVSTGFTLFLVPTLFSLMVDARESIGRYWEKNIAPAALQRP